MWTAKRIAMLTILLLFCGCGKTAPENQKIEQKEITSFSYHHAGSAADDAQSFVFTKEESGVRLYAEWNGGGARLDTAVEDAVLTELAEIVFTHRMQKWDGFDKASKTALDGDSFALRVAFADGTAISARGNQAFLKGYGEAKKDFFAVFQKHLEMYADEVVTEEE